MDSHKHKGVFSAPSGSLGAALQPEPPSQHPQLAPHVILPGEGRSQTICKQLQRHTSHGDVLFFLTRPCSQRGTSGQGTSLTETAAPDRYLVEGTVQTPNLKR
jgi:hypothetical protein